MMRFHTRNTMRRQKNKEDRILDNFIESGFFENLKTKRYNYTLVYEPCTGFGYADLVCIRWNRSIQDKWNSKRSIILEDDIKILHYLYNAQIEKSVVQMQNDLGFKSRTLLSIVDRLMLADLIAERNSRFKIRPLNEIFFIYEIIAVEAKISDWKKALEQSFNNMFFASRSFSLFPEKTINQNMLSAYGKADVGVLSVGKKCRQVLKSGKMKIPASLTAWRFNEMLGRGLIS